jgi:hypothetical protein
VPQVDFSSENKLSRGADTSFPTLKFAKDERARIICLEPRPWYEWTHRLQMPKLLNGKAVTSTFTKKNGEEYTNYEFDFIGNPICLGDLGIIEDGRGTDPANCPVCALAEENSDMALPPIRRFAMHIFRYATKPGTFELVSPFSGGMLVWRYTETTFNKLTDFATEHGQLQRHDLLLGPCTNPAFQQFDINVGSKAEWLMDPVRKQLVIDTYKGNKAESLAAYCGRKAERRWLEDDLRRLRQRWAEVARTSGYQLPDLGGVTLGQDNGLTAGLEDLIQQQSDTSVQSVPTVTAAVGAVLAQAVNDLESTIPAEASTQDDLDSLLSGATDLPTVPVADVAKAGSGEDLVDFDELLNGL